MIEWIKKFWARGKIGLKIIPSVLYILLILVGIFALATAIKMMVNMGGWTAFVEGLKTLW